MSHHSLTRKLTLSSDYTDLNQSKRNPRHNWNSQLTEVLGTCLAWCHPHMNSGCFTWQRFRRGNSSAPENCPDLPHRGDSRSEPAMMEESGVRDTSAECSWLHFMSSLTARVICHLAYRNQNQGTEKDNLPYS